ncbi:MAG: aspartate kinase [Planctomycetes bacterium]|nr:aspartate kinase [Planctomycetota bacterium]
MKFGGAALADGPAVERVCALVREQGGPRPALVVSAHQGVTEMLDTVARSAAAGIAEGDRVRIRHRTLLSQLGLDSELLDRHFSEFFSLLDGIQKRGQMALEERDLVLSFGERMSARIVAQALRARGVLATPVDAFDLGLTSDSVHGNAQPQPESLDEVREALEQVTGIPVVTGFLAKDRHGNLTTLGRNGSDLTAALVAEAVGASELQLWKAVGGLMTADPRLVPDARVIDQLGFAEAAEYAFHGAEVLHAAALAPARRAAISVRLLDVNQPAAPGTRLDPQTRDHGPCGIATRKRIVRVLLPLGPESDRVTRIAELFAHFARKRVEIGPLRHTGEHLSVLATPGPALDLVLAELGRRVRAETELALVAVIGRHGGDGAIADSAVRVLLEAGIEPIESHVGSRDLSQAFLVRAADLERAARALHGALLGRVQAGLAARAGG